VITVALIYKTMYNGSIAVTAEVEVARNSINLKESFHSAAFLFIDIPNNLIYFLIISKLTIIILYILWQSYFLKIVVYIYKMYFQNVLDIER